MKEWGNYWREVCAPKLKKKKDELGRAMPEKTIAAAVHLASGKNTSRGLVSLWLLGEREPYISQFYALCEKLELDPEEVLKHDGVKTRVPLRRFKKQPSKVLEQQKRKVRQ